VSRVEGVEGTFDSPLTERKIPRLYPISQRGPITVAVGTFSSTSRTLLPELDENNRDISSDTPAGPSMPRQTRPRASQRRLIFIRISCAAIFVMFPLLLGFELRSSGRTL
jgi:hypothetical protein